MELFTVPYKEENVIRAVVSFDPPNTSSDHIIDDGSGKYIVSTTGGVLLGKMSFQLLADEFDISGFSLVEDSSSSPKTGIKISVSTTDSYEAQSTFRFTDATASKDASLSNLIVSSGIQDLIEPTNSTYKEYTYTPIFNKETYKYDLELLEYIDSLDIKAIKSDANSTMKIKYPKRGEDGTLIKDPDSGEVIYDEQDLTSDVPYNVIINKLGEPDTKITIVITAEDGKTVNSYDLVIARPYGMIKGSIYTAPTISTTEKYIATVKAYNSDEVNSVVDWTTITEGELDSVHDSLMILESRDIVTNDDGTYELYVIPGKYDILLDKTGYLDHIYISNVINAGDVIDLGYKELLAGDLNKDGSIQILDMSSLLSVYGSDNTAADFEAKADFNEDNQIQILDLSIFLSNYNTNRVIE